MTHNVIMFFDKTYSAIEIALDNNKVVREVTYLITEPRFKASVCSL